MPLLFGGSFQLLIACVWNLSYALEYHILSYHIVGDKTLYRARSIILHSKCAAFSFLSMLGVADARISIVKPLGIRFCILRVCF